MASPSYTYTLTNGTTADASQVMQDFTDILNGVTDGTKDLSISALTCAGTATLNGNVNIGNASADDLTITASLASTIAIKTTNSFNIGSATLGLAGIYFGTGDTDTARIVSASLAASRTYTLPDAGGAADFVMTAGAQTAAGVKTFSSGITLGNETLSLYRTGTQASTWTDNGTGSPGTSASVTMILTRIGNIVVCYIPIFTIAATGTNPTQITNVTVIANSQFIPTVAQRITGGYPNVSAAAFATPGQWIVNTDGSLNFRKDGVGGVFGSGNTNGLANPTTITWTVN